MRLPSPGVPAIPAVVALVVVFLTLALQLGAEAGLTPACLPPSYPC